MSAHLLPVTVAWLERLPDGVAVMAGVTVYRLHRPPSMIRMLVAANGTSRIDRSDLALVMVDTLTEAERDAALEEVARLVAKRDEARAEVERLQGEVTATRALAGEWHETGKQAVDDCMIAAVEMDDAHVPGEEVPERVRWLLAEVERLRTEAAQLRATAGALTPGRIRVAVLAAIDAVHVAPPAWAESVADDVLARLQS